MTDTPDMMPEGPARSTPACCSVYTLHCTLALLPACPATAAPWLTLTLPAPGTMVVHDGPNTPIPGPIRSMSPDPPPSATRPDYLRSAAAAYAPASDYASTMVVTPAAEQRGCFSEDNDSYMAALRAAGADVPCPSSAAGEDDSYMAALRSAAAESDRRPGSQQHSPINPPSTYRRCGAVVVTSSLLRCATMAHAAASGCTHHGNGHHSTAQPGPCHGASMRTVALADDACMLNLT